VVTFLASGPPPVYVGLGSMSGRDAARLTALVLDALRRAGRRGILLSGWAGLGEQDVGDDICVVRDIPHDWLFPQVSAVVHHGGAGTTGAGLRAGKPSVLLPFFADQPFWGRRVHQLGAGPRPIPQKRLTVEGLAAAIRIATTDPHMAGKARMLGERIRAEDGVERAVGLLRDRLGA
jgi:sterol 3beta-glucosyltransferase